MAIEAVAVDVSKRRGTQHMKRRNYGRNAEPYYAVTFASCASADDLPEARQLSHDQLIRLAAGHRRGPVQWIMYAAAEAPGVIANVDPADDAGHLAYLADYPGGFLVMARCLATRGQTVRPSS